MFTSLIVLVLLLVKKVLPTFYSPDNHQHITDYLVRVVFGQSMAHWVVPNTF